jgi:site-specific DNA recombinase
MNKGFFGIVRISTITNKDNNSLPNQKKVITKYCKDNGLNLIGFIEEIESGNKGLERKGIKELKQYIEDGIVDGVVFLKYDRLGRNLYETLKLIKYLDKNNIQMCSVLEGWKSDTIQGKMMVSILLSFSEFEKDTLVSRMLCGRINNFDDGRKSSGDICFGYMKNQDGYIVENPNESKIVKYIFKKYLEKKHLPKTKLSQIILKGCRRLGFEYRNGKELKSYHIKYFLKNKWYGGLQTFGKNGMKKHFHPRIVSTQLFNKVNKDLVYG